MPYFKVVDIINMHTQALYWRCIQLIKDVHLNHGGKITNNLWTIMCTCSIFTTAPILVRHSSKQLFLHNTATSITTIAYLYHLNSSCLQCCQLLIQPDQTCMVSFCSNLCPFPC